MSAILDSLRQRPDFARGDFAGTRRNSDHTPVVDTDLREISRQQGQALRSAFGGRPESPRATAVRERVAAHRASVTAPAKPAAPATPKPGQVWVPQEILDGGRAAYPILDAMALQVPAGRYALPRREVTAAGNDATFFEVTEAKRTGKHYIKQLLGAPGSFTERRLTVREQYFALKHLIAEGDAAAVLFGRLTKTCSDCGSPLTNAVSRGRGIGPKCWYKPRFAAVREVSRQR
jgi:hypothetical protein